MHLVSKCWKVIGITGKRKEQIKESLDGHASMMGCGAKIGEREGVSKVDSAERNILVWWN